MSGRAFTLTWTGPYTVDSDDLRALADRSGVYAITQRRWWRKTLLYIGMTYFQGFYKRITQHRRGWLSEVRGKVRVRVATVVPQRGSRISEKNLRDIEALLIFAHQPSRATRGTKNYNGRPGLRVVNRGRRGELAKRVWEEGGEVYRT
jgi:hypothetical protein